MNNPANLALSFLQTRTPDAARVLDELDEEDVAAFIASVPADVAGAVIGHMLRWRAAACLQRLAPDKAASVLVAMDFYDAVDLLRQIPSPERRSILAEIPRGAGRGLQAALRYPDGTVGSLMDPSLPMFPHDATARDALFQVKKWRADISHVFLYRAEKRFYGAVAISALVKVHSGTSLTSIADNRVPHILSQADLLSVSQQPGWDDYPVRPVVNAEKRLLGGLSRSVLRRHLHHPTSVQSQIAPAVLASNMFTAYVQSCHTLFGLIAGLVSNDAGSIGKGAKDDRKR